MTIYVLIPAYNVENYVTLCLDSVLAQTYPHFQILCVNDGSKDKTASILKKYAQKDKRIHVFNQQNQGLTKTLNVLLNHVPKSADYIFYLDADDFIAPETFEKMLKVATQYQCDVVECGTIRCAANTRKIPTAPSIQQSPTVIKDMSIFWSNKTRQGNWIVKWNKLYQWSRIKNIRFREQLTGHEDDYFYACEVNQKIKSKVIISDIFHFYRKNPTSLNGRLNCQRYVNATGNRIQLSYDTFLKTGIVPQKYQEDFKDDLAKDTFRMVIRKNLKKNTNWKNCHQVFLQSADFINHFYDQKIVDFNRLNLWQQWIVWCVRKHLFILAKISIILT